MNKKRSCCCWVLPATWKWLLLLLGLPLLFMLMMGSRQGVIEGDLASRSEAALKEAGMGWAKVSLAGRGRDLQLRGTAASETERDDAAKLAQNVYGVRDVQNLIEIAAPGVMSGSAISNPGSRLQVSTEQTMPEKPDTPEASETLESQGLAVAPEQPATTSETAGLSEQEQPVAPPTPDASTAVKQANDDLTQEAQLASAGANETSQEQPQVADNATSSVEEQAVQGCQQQLDEAMSSKTILFATNKAVTRQASNELLDSLAGIISTCKSVLTGRYIEVGGHTDSVGNDAYNLKLSQQRADAVRAYLVSKGIDGLLIKSVGYGESQPVASNDTAEGRSQNRRISFEIKPE